MHHMQQNVFLREKDTKMFTSIKSIQCGQKECTSLSKRVLKQTCKQHVRGYLTREIF